jgi:hypothetical protein
MMIPNDENFFDGYLKQNRKRVSEIMGKVARDILHRSMTHDLELMKDPIHDKLVRVFPKYKNGEALTDDESNAIYDMSKTSDYQPVYHDHTFRDMTLVQYIEWLADFKAQCALDGKDPMYEIVRIDAIPRQIRHVLINTLEDWRKIN